MIKTALFLKTKNIGDSIILTSSIAALPKTFKYVDVVCLPESEPVVGAGMNETARACVVHVP